MRVKQMLHVLPGRDNSVTCEIGVTEPVFAEHWSDFQHVGWRLVGQPNKENRRKSNKMKNK
jgi:hypothetical protein